MSALPSPSPSSAAAFTPARVLPHAAHAFGGIWRLTFRRLLMPSHWLTVAIALAVLTLVFAGGPRGGGVPRFIDWTINFYITFLVPVMAFLMAGGAMRDEMKSGTVDYVLTRPVSRPAFVGFKYIAHTICAQIDFLFAFGVVVAFATVHDVPNLAGVAVRLLFGQVLLVTVFSALGFLCGVVTGRYVIIGIVYALLIEFGVGQIPTQLSRLSMTMQLRELLSLLLERAAPHAGSPGVIATVAILFAVTGCFLVGAAAIFSLRELTGPADA